MKSCTCLSFVLHNLIIVTMAKFALKGKNDKMHRYQVRAKEHLNQIKVAVAAEELNKTVLQSSDI